MTETTPTRRSFLKGGALLAAPLGAAASAAVIADDGLKARLLRLEDEAAIRALHRTWLLWVNARETEAAAPRFAHSAGVAFDQAVRSVVADHAGEPESIEIAADGRTAVGRFPCALELETAIPQDCTLAQMAHAQGGGFVRRTERSMLKVEYVKHACAWAIASVELASL